MTFHNAADAAAAIPARQQVASRIFDRFGILVAQRSIEDDEA